MNKKSSKSRKLKNKTDNSLKGTKWRFKRTLNRKALANKRKAKNIRNKRFNFKANLKRKNKNQTVMSVKILYIRKKLRNNRSMQA